MSLTFRAGSRKRLHARVLITGPAKAGKSYTAQLLAYLLSPPAGIFVIEAGEFGRTEIYCGNEEDGKRWTMDHIMQLDACPRCAGAGEVGGKTCPACGGRAADNEPSYSPETYTEAIRAAISAGRVRRGIVAGPGVHIRDTCAGGTRLPNNCPLCSTCRPTRGLDGGSRRLGNAPARTRRRR